MGERNREQESKRGNEDLNSLFTRVKARRSRWVTVEEGVRGVGDWLMGFEGAAWHE